MQTSHRTALLLDDNRAMLRALRTILFQFGFAPVHESQTVDEATFLLDRIEPPNLCLVDYHLGDRTGLHFVRELRQRQTLHHVPVFLVTSDAIPEVRARAAKVGTNGVIEKPVSPTVLKQAITSLVG